MVPPSLGGNCHEAGRWANSLFGIKAFDRMVDVGEQFQTDRQRDDGDCEAKPLAEIGERLRHQREI